MKSRLKKNQIFLDRCAVGDSRRIYSEMKNIYGRLAPETRAAADILSIDIEMARRSEIFKMKCAKL